MGEAVRAEARRGWWRGRRLVVGLYFWVWQGAGARYQGTGQLRVEPDGEPLVEWCKWGISTCVTASRRWRRKLSHRRRDRWHRCTATSTADYWDEALTTPSNRQNLHDVPQFINEHSPISQARDHDSRISGSDVNTFHARPAVNNSLQSFFILITVT